MPTRRVRARVATTHALPAYGGIRLAENAIRQMAEQLAAGAIPMRYQHDLARPVFASNVIAGIEELEDGELAAWIEFDVDEDQWALVQQEWANAGAPGGFSFSTAESFATRGEPPYDVQIAADASYFDDAFLVAAAADSLPTDVTVELARLYQFSWIPDPKIMIDLTQSILVSIPGNLLSSYLYDLGSKFKSRLTPDPRPPIFEIRVRRTRRSRTTTVKISTTSDDGLRRAMEAVPAILRAEGQTAHWDDEGQRWEPIATRPDDDEPPAVVAQRRSDDQEHSSGVQQPVAPSEAENAP